MMSDTWLHPTLVLLDLSATALDDVLAHVAHAAAPVTGLPAAPIEQALREAARSGGFALGRGVAVPHADIPGLEETTVALVRTRQPLNVSAPDGRPADLFFVVLSRPRDPRRHLLLLAHVARLAQSRILLEALRQADTAEDTYALVQAASLRHATTPEVALPVPEVTHYLAIISVAGERTTDALLVALLDQDLDDAAIVEAQSMREAVTCEVPLFAGFRDIFGDPGGRRLIVTGVPAERVGSLTAAVRRVFEEHREEIQDMHRPGSGRLMLLPLQSHWAWGPAPAEPAAGGGH